jgi:hypothetical protein
LRPTAALWLVPSEEFRIQTRYEYMVKVSIDQALHDKAKRAAEVAGYSSVDEFVAHCIEIEIKRLKLDEGETQVADQLRGLGYIE